MTRRFGTGRLNRSRGNREEVNPMDSVANLADVMLVFACGLMVSLIYYYNVDINTTGDYVEAEIATQIEEIDGVTDGDSSGGDGEGYTEMGKVYQGPDGNYYMFIEGEEGE